MKEILALLSAILIIVAAPPYIIDTVKGKTKPQRVTWLIFSVLGLIAFFSQLSLGATWSLVFLGFDTSASILAFILSVKYGVGGHSRLDTIALTIAGSGVLLALLAKQPIIALLGVILADISGVTLTIRKAYTHPGTETAISWWLVGTASLLGVLTVGEVKLSLLIYPIYLLIVNYAVPVAQIFGYKLNKKTSCHRSIHST